MRWVRLFGSTRNRERFRSERVAEKAFVYLTFTVRGAAQEVIGADAAAIDRARTHVRWVAVRVIARWAALSLTIRRPGRKIAFCRVIANEAAPNGRRIRARLRRRGEIERRFEARSVFVVGALAVILSLNQTMNPNVTPSAIGGCCIITSLAGLPPVSLPVIVRKTNCLVEQRSLSTGFRRRLLHLAERFVAFLHLADSVIASPFWRRLLLHGTSGERKHTET